MELRQIARDVHVCLQEDRGLGCSNSGLVSRGGGLVVDTFWDLPHTRELRSLYASVHPEPVQRVVNTHANGDHCWGNQCFAGAEIIAQRASLQRLARERPEAMEALRGMTGHADPAVAAFAQLLRDWDFRGITPVAPTRLFDESLQLDLDGLQVELLHVGPAHTAEDAIVHLPEPGVVFAGDVVFRLCTPIGWEGSFEVWGRALERIVELEPAVIVPGHGPLCGVEGALEMKAYLEYVRDEARTCFEAELDVAEASRRIDPGPYAGWTEPWRIVFQVERAYRELRGEAWDAPVDAVGLFRIGLSLGAGPPRPPA